MYVGIGRNKCEEKLSFPGNLEMGGKEREKIERRVVLSKEESLRGELRVEMRASEDIRCVPRHVLS